MAHVSVLPCDGDGVCMVCKTKPSTDETLTCKTCVTPWHVACLAVRPPTMADAVSWECPDCLPLSGDAPATAIGASKQIRDEASSDLVAAIRSIEADSSLTDREKAKKRQELMSRPKDGRVDGDGDCSKGNGRSLLDLMDGSLNCSICMQWPERPVTTPCGHNFCLKCFEKWVGQGKKTCANCRSSIPPKMASQPRINSTLVAAIRMAKVSKANTGPVPDKVYHFVQNQNRPDKCFVTERAKKTGKANACSGKIFVTVPPDHFGPILAENDPERNQGVLVGELWEDRMECRQWGAHLPHVAGIAGQSGYGAQSVALSGGYEDDEDHGEWFLYTGSGGRDLSGNKRTNKEQSFDQKFDKMNEALRVSCKKGYPVRVVRSHKEKRSSYAPEVGVRYDGVYRIEKCWRKPGVQGFKVCRYLFVRCDNEPAPWTSNDHGDRPRPLPAIPELKNATDITERKESPAWGFDEEKGCWVWKQPPPASRKAAHSHNMANVANGTSVRIVSQQTQKKRARVKLLREFGCEICRKVMTLPLTTPCAHNFCKACLEGVFAGQSFVRQRNCEGRRSLRAQKTIMKCPSCSTEITDFLQNPQVNRELMNLIESLKQEAEEELEENDEKSNKDDETLEEDTNIIAEDEVSIADENEKKTNSIEKSNEDDATPEVTGMIIEDETNNANDNEEEAEEKKTNSDSCISDEKISPEEPIVAADDGSEDKKSMKSLNVAGNVADSPLKAQAEPEAAPEESKDVRNSKRKKPTRGRNVPSSPDGAMTRRSKRTKT